MTYYTVLLLLFTFWAGCLGDDQNTLRKLQVVFRHGYRYPIRIIWTDNDKCASSYNSSLLGTLTNLGKSQMSMLGYFIRVHYNTFSGLQKGDSVDLYSSNSARNNESAALVYEGIFKNFGDTTKNIQLVNPSWDGQTHTNSNSLLDTSSNREKYKSLMSILMQWKSDKTEVTLNDLSSASDQLICEMPEGCTLPAWLNITVQEQLLSFKNEKYASLTDCQHGQMVKDNADELLKEITAVFDPSKAANTKDVTLYSLHDTNIAMLLTRLKVFNGIRAPFGAAIFFELHNITNNLSEVRVFYDNSTDYTNLQQLKLPDCGWNCSYEDFVKLATDKAFCSLGGQL